MSGTSQEYSPGAARARAPLGPSPVPVGPGGPPAPGAPAGALWRRVPNLLTGARLAAAPAVLLVYLAADRPLADWLALGLFVAAAMTDFLDGWLARRLGCVSALGRMLDPVADKAMVTVALALLLVLEARDAGGLAVPAAPIAIPAAAILLREALVSGLREHLGGIGLSVTSLAKWKTTAQMTAIAALLLASALRAEGIAEGLLYPSAVAMLWVAAGLTVITGWDYLNKGLEAMARTEDR